MYYYNSHNNYHPVQTNTPATTVPGPSVRSIPAQAHGGQEQHGNRFALDERNLNILAVAAEVVEAPRSAARNSIGNAHGSPNQEEMEDQTIKRTEKFVAKSKRPSERKKPKEGISNTFRAAPIPGGRKSPGQATVAGPSNSAPQSFSDNIEDEDEEPISEKEWAENYKAGRLRRLGLQVGVWGQHIEVVVPHYKKPCPGTLKPGEKRAGKHPAGDYRKGKHGKPSWAWALYVLLAKIPGGQATTEVLEKMVEEWCPYHKPTTEGARSSCGHALSVWNQPDNLFMLINRGDGQKKSWRISNIGETREKGPGPEVGVAPAHLQKGKKGVSPARDNENADSPEMANSLASPRSLSTQVPSPNPDNSKTTSPKRTSSPASSQSLSTQSTSPDRDNGNTRDMSMASGPATSGWTSVNGPRANGFMAPRTPLPTTKRQREHDDESKDIDHSAGFRRAHAD